MFLTREHEEQISGLGGAPPASVAMSQMPRPDRGHCGPDPSPRATKPTAPDTSPISRHTDVPQVPAQPPAPHRPKTCPRHSTLSHLASWAFGADFNARTLWSIWLSGTFQKECGGFSSTPAVSRERTHSTHSGDSGSSPKGGNECMEKTHFLCVAHAGWTGPRARGLGGHSDSVYLTGAGGRRHWYFLLGLVSVYLAQPSSGHVFGACPDMSGMGHSSAGLCVGNLSWWGRQGRGESFWWAVVGPGVKSPPRLAWQVLPPLVCPKNQPGVSLWGRYKLRSSRL